MVSTRDNSSTVVKIKSGTHAKLQDISRDEERPMGEIITFLVERYERERFWRTAAADLQRLKADEDSWRKYHAESVKLGTLANAGLESEPPFFTEEEEEQIRAEIATDT